jgi:hypothetical protein
MEDSNMTRTSDSSNPAYRLAVAASCARTLLLTLGIDSAKLPDIGTLIDSPAPIVRPKVVLPPAPSGRFRRTDREIEECKALETWQLARRNGSSADFLIEIAD